MRARSHSITAVIPCLNHGAYLRSSVESALGQADVDVRVVVVDDGSTDAETLDLYGNLQRDSRVTVLRGSGRGPGAARNVGLACVLDPYAIVLDADDWIDPTFARSCISVLEEDQRVVAASSWIKCFGDASWRLRPSGGGPAEFVVRNECGSMAVLRMSAWKQAAGYSESLAYEDWDFYLRLVGMGGQIVIVEDYLAHYRVSTRSRNVDVVLSRPAAVAQIVAEHEILFASHVVDAVVGREELIARLREQPASNSEFIPFGDGTVADLLSRSWHENAD